MKLKIEDINRREIYRYLGYRGQTPDETVCQMIEEVLRELTRVIQPKYLYQGYQCSIQEDAIRLSDEQHNDVAIFTSMNLAENLNGCHKVILMAATLGIEADKLLQRY